MTTPYSCFFSSHHRKTLPHHTSRHSPDDDSANVAMKQTLTAIYKNDLSGLQSVLHAGLFNINSRITQDNNTALGFASAKGKTTIVSFLLEQPGIDINLENNDGHSPLMLALMKGHQDVAEQLLEQDNIEVCQHQRLRGRTALHIAAAKGYLHVVKLLLNKGAPINQIDRAGFSALSLATKCCHAKVVRLLLSQEGINLGLSSEGAAAHQPMTSPFFIAASKGYSNIIHVFLEVLKDRPQDLQELANQTDQWGAKPISIAAENNNLDIVRLLAPLTHSSSVSSHSVSSRSHRGSPYSSGLFILGPSHNSYSYGTPSPLQVIKDSATQGGLPLQIFGNGMQDKSWHQFKKLRLHLGAFAIVHCHGDWDKRLQKHTLSLSEQESIPTTQVALELYKMGVRDMTFFSCKIGMAAQRCMQRINHDPDWPKPIDPSLRITFVGGENSTLVSTNIDDVHARQTDYLSYRNGQKNPEQRSILENMTINGMAVLSYSVDTQSMNIKHKSPLKMEERTLSEEQKQIVQGNWLLKRIERGQAKFEKVKAMIEATPNLVNYRGVTGVTPLFFAVDVGHVETVRWLLEKGALVNQINNFGSTPLHIASKLGRLHIAKCLLDQGAAVNQANIFGVTPLHIAAHQGNFAITQHLLAKGAQVNQVDNNGRTPLDFAAKKGHEPIVQLLMAHAV